MSDKEKAIVGEVQRLKCMCGEIRCASCGHAMTGRHPDPKYCPNCGRPMSKALNSSGGQSDRTR